MFCYMKHINILWDVYDHIGVVVIENVLSLCHPSHVIPFCIVLGWNILDGT